MAKSTRKSSTRANAKQADLARNTVDATDQFMNTDQGLRIKRFTPRATDIFNIIPGDIGRSLLDITSQIDYPQLTEDATAAFESLKLIEREVRSSDGRWHAVRVLPYRTGENLSMARC